VRPRLVAAPTHHQNHRASSRPGSGTRSSKFSGGAADVAPIGPRRRPARLTAGGRSRWSRWSFAIGAGDSRSRGARLNSPRPPKVATAGKPLLAHDLQDGVVPGNTGTDHHVVRRKGTKAGNFPAVAAYQGLTSMPFCAQLLGDLVEFKGRSAGSPITT